ncbi:MAG: C39 family peptidase [Synergistaceae bacterium]|jgi:ABC-type bacteriocin/lantibiotic exporter with double-glycine peptidase domain|nr:C39 family peptidase [Synergistaceae bacterium]
MTKFMPRKLIKIPQTGQATFYTCGVAVLQSILYYNGIEYSQDDILPMVGSTPEHGTAILALNKFLNDNGVRAEIWQNITFDGLRDFIDGDRPMICILQAWNDDPRHDYSDTWNDGHYVVAIGYDDDRFYFMDPYTIANYTYIENKDFLARWHARNGGVRYLNAGIVVANPNPVYRPDVFMPME